MSLHPGQTVNMLTVSNQITVEMAMFTGSTHWTCSKYTVTILLYKLTHRLCLHPDLIVNVLTVTDHCKNGHVHWINSQHIDSNQPTVQTDTLCLHPDQTVNTLTVSDRTIIKMDMFTGSTRLQELKAVKITMKHPDWGLYTTDTQTVWRHMTLHKPGFAQSEWHSCTLFQDLIGFLFLFFTAMHQIYIPHELHPLI